LKKVVFSLQEEASDETLGEKKRVYLAEWEKNLIFANGKN